MPVEGKGVNYMWGAPYAYPCTVGLQRYQIRGPCRETAGYSP